MTEQNPASAASTVTKVTSPVPGARKRIPMSTPQQRMQVADLPGYHLHWFLESRVPRALQAGYEFVEDSEVNVNQKGAANKGDVSGNTDLGTQVRVIAGIGENGNPESHVL